MKPASSTSAVAHERDAGQRRLLVKTPEGRMLLHFPPAALQNVKKGDNVTVELALKDNGPAAKTK
ncbi:MAG: hypothetical protein ACRELZ_09875 [Candidatus Rokuibacteriota bacterium]